MVHEAIQDWVYLVDNRSIHVIGMDSYNCQVLLAEEDALE